jgi:hypothetical protein
MDGFHGCVILLQFEHRKTFNVNIVRADTTKPEADAFI